MSLIPMCTTLKILSISDENLQSYVHSDRNYSGMYVAQLYPIQQG